MPRDRDSDYTIVEPRYSYTYSISPFGTAPARKGSFFGKREIKHIAIAVTVLTAAFTLVLWDRSVETLGLTFVEAALAVLLGFFLHEMAHKYVAKKYGCWAEFRAYYNGLLFALVLSFMGLLFAAPGAVYIAGNVSREQNGRISIAGPATNMAIAAATLPFCLVGELPEVVREVATVLMFLNVLLAGFNLVPVPPLDGSKVWAWDKRMYVLSIAVAGLLFTIMLLFGITPF
jgi:Zn-dependent protease